MKAGCARRVLQIADFGENQPLYPRQIRPGAQTQCCTVLLQV